MNQKNLSEISKKRESEYRLIALLPRKAAFTLAEVLITLGIIGVVAAMTIPALISNYQKRVWTAQLQKVYAVLNQGFRRMLADDNVSALSQTETFQSIGGTELGSTHYRRCAFDNSSNSKNCKEFYNNLNKYFKNVQPQILDVATNYNVHNLNGANRGEAFTPYKDNVIFLTDGIMLLRFGFYSNPPIYTVNTLINGQAGYFYVDVNGLKRPNKMGRDIFRFYLGDNGIAYPVGSVAVADYIHNTGDGNCENSIEECYWKTANEKYNCKTDGISIGDGCAARILEKGKMNY